MAEDFPIFIRCILKLLPLQGALLIALYPGRCPGLRASALSGRAAVDFLAFWALLLICAFGPSGRAAVDFLAFWALLLICAFGPSGRAAVDFLAFWALLLIWAFGPSGRAVVGF